jgi:hypothetical protein
MKERTERDWDVISRTIYDWSELIIWIGKNHNEVLREYEKYKKKVKVK